MGINDLFKIMDLENVTINDLVKKRGIKSVAIDMSCWLHRFKYARNCEMAIDVSSTAFLELFLVWLEPFINNKIKICIVFDGKTPEFKKHEHESRRMNFETKKVLAKTLMESCDQEEVHKGRMFMVQTIEVSTLVKATKNEIDRLKAADVDINYVDAEYESDLLLAKMCHKKEVDLVITEDSDLAAYKTPLVLFKYSPQLYNFTRKLNSKNERPYKDPNEEYCGKLFDIEQTTIKWKINKSANISVKKIKDFELFVEFCVLSGCDYYKGLPKIGPKTALKYCLSNESFIKKLEENDNDYSMAIKIFKQIS
jgi:5'-3' exonuclease